MRVCYLGGSRHAVFRWFLTDVVHKGRDRQRHGSEKDVETLKSAFGHIEGCDVTVWTDTEPKQVSGGEALLHHCVRDQAAEQPCRLRFCVHTMQHVITYVACAINTLVISGLSGSKFVKEIQVSVCCIVNGAALGFAFTLIGASSYSLVTFTFTSRIRKHNRDFLSH